MRKTDVEKLKDLQGIIDRKLKTRKLADYKVESVGGYYKKDEIFVPQPHIKGYYVSNYGRIISEKYNNIRLIKQLTKQDKGKNTKYKYYRPRFRNKTKHMSVHRAVAEAFCPNLYKDVEIRNKNGDLLKPEVHHLNHREDDNRAENLLWLPKDLHLLCNSIGEFGIWRKKTAKHLHPLEIVRQTGLDLRDIITAVQTEPIKKTDKWIIYDVKGHKIALKLLAEYGENGFKKKSAK